jgi:hypothetical protein
VASRPEEKDPAPAAMRAYRYRPDILRSTTPSL